MSKGSSNLQNYSTNNENNINKHNINNNSSNGQNDRQVFLTPLVRFRRVLSSIYHHANNVSSEAGDRVHALIVGLVVSIYYIFYFIFSIIDSNSKFLSFFV